MLLPIFIGFLSLIYVYSSKWIDWISNASVPMSPEERSLYESILQLKSDLSKISIMDEFAKYAKIERKINGLMNERKKFFEARAKSISQAKTAFKTTYHIASGLVFIILMWSYNNSGIFQLNHNWFFPVNWIFAFPSMFNTSDIGIPFWIFITKTFFQTFDKTIADHYK